MKGEEVCFLSLRTVSQEVQDSVADGHVTFRQEGVGDDGVKS